METLYPILKEGYDVGEPSFVLMCLDFFETPIMV